MLERLRRNLTATDVVLWIIRISIILAIIWGSATTLVSGKYSGDHWINFLVFGLAQGSVYALIALGYTLVYGILLMINFAHGEVFMSGAFTAYHVALAFGESGFLDRNPVVALLICLLVSVLTSIGVAVLLERVAYRPLRKAPRLVPLITAIGASFFLQYTFRGFYGSGVRAYPDIEALEGKWNIFGIAIGKTHAIVIVASFVLLVGLYLFVQRTKTGKAMRAVAQDKEVAALMGIDVDQVIVITFALGAAMAGAAGVLYALIFKQVHFFMGFVPGIKAFTAAVLGGIGNPVGAAIGGLFLGVFESIGPSLFLDGLGIAAPYQLKDVIAFSMLVLVLIFLPSGILGEELYEKKA
jgi:branched-chain amino acid transport system permease protein